MGQGVVGLESDLHAALGHGSLENPGCFGSSPGSEAVTVAGQVPRVVRAALNEVGKDGEGLVLAAH